MNVDRFYSFLGRGVVLFFIATTLGSLIGISINSPLSFETTIFLCLLMALVIETVWRIARSFGQRSFFSIIFTLSACIFFGVTSGMYADIGTPSRAAKLIDSCKYIKIAIQCRETDFLTKSVLALRCLSPKFFTIERKDSHSVACIGETTHERTYYRYQEPKSIPAVPTIETTK